MRYFFMSSQHENIEFTRSVTRFIHFMLPIGYKFSLIEVPLKLSISTQRVQKKHFSKFRMLSTLQIFIFPWPFYL